MECPICNLSVSFQCADSKICLTSRKRNLEKRITINEELIEDYKKELLNVTNLLNEMEKDKGES